jgi:Tol biopolymer transport system component/DNA-binding winged helix-turn-helix (wHTH) protein
MRRNSKHFYDFGPFRVDGAERLLLRGDQVVPLTPKTFEMLLVLLERSGHVLTKDELMKRVWPDTIVEEANLSHNIYKLREALGEGRNGEKYIETLPRRGYRFVANVTEVRDEDSNLLIAEEVRAQIVIEEDDSSPAKEIVPAREVVIAVPQSRRLDLTRRPSTMTILVVATVTLLLGGAFLVQRRWFAARSATTLTLSPVRTIPLTTFPDEELDPALSPDGRLVAYAWKGGTKDSVNIYVQQVDGGTPLRLTKVVGREGSPQWSPDGRYIAFFRGSLEPGKTGIYLIPALGGPERLLYAAAPGRIDWSPDGRYLLFCARQFDPGPVWIGILTIDSLEVRRLTAPPPVTYGDGDASFSPDGQRVAFIRHTDNTGEIFVVPAVGGDPRQVTFDNRRMDTVVWTPDGRELVFSSNRAGSYSLWRISPEGGTPVHVEGIGLDARQPSIARAGGRLVYSQQSIDTNIWRIPTHADAGSRLKLIGSTRRDENPRLSPDGQKIVFESNRSGSRELWMSDSDGSNQAQLSYFGGPITTNGRWSPDGRQLAFDSRPDGHAQIFLISVNGGPVHRLTNEPYDSLAPSWSRDGRWIYFGSNRSGLWQIWKMPAAGGAPIQVTSNGGYEAIEAVDGQSIFYNKQGFLTVGLFQLSLAGGTETRVLDLPQLESFSDWTVTAEGIYYINRYDLHLKMADPVTVNFFDFGTGQVKTVVPLEHDPTSNPGLNISTDGRWFIYSIDDHRDFDIMLVENFH